MNPSSFPSNTPARSTYAYFLGKVLLVSRVLATPNTSDEDISLTFDPPQPMRVISTDPSDLEIESRSSPPHGCPEWRVQPIHTHAVLDAVRGYTNLRVQGAASEKPNALLSTDDWSLDPEGDHWPNQYAPSFARAEEVFQAYQHRIEKQRDQAREVTELIWNQMDEIRRLVGKLAQARILKLPEVNDTTEPYSPQTPHADAARPKRLMLFQLISDAPSSGPKGGFPTQRDRPFLVLSEEGEIHILQPATEAEPARLEAWDFSLYEDDSELGRDTVFDLLVEYLQQARRHIEEEGKVLARDQERLQRAQQALQSLQQTETSGTSA